MSITSHAPEFATETVSRPRTWPALLIVALGGLLYASIFLFVMAPDAVPAIPVFMASMWGPMLMTLVLAFWWLLLGPASFKVRVATTALAFLLVAASMAAADSSVHMFMMSWGIPLAVGLVALFACAFWWLRPGLLLTVTLIIGLLALLPWQLIRRDQGVTGDFGMDAGWRWAPHADDIAVSFDQGKKVEAPATTPPVQAGDADWPGFRGAQRDGVVTTVSLDDWQTPPKEVWRRPVGPGWSSLCVIGDRLYTQEQRGDEELVTCYRADNGELLWTHADQVRYNDAMSGTGPRGTPTFHDGKLYTFGGTGILNCLDAATGKRLWKVDATQHSKGLTPPFGYATSPLVLGDHVILHPGVPVGEDPSSPPPRVLAYDAATGKEVRRAGTASASYCSPQLSTIGGQPQLLIYNSDGLFAHDPATGKELWSYAWVVDATAASVVQPMVLADDYVVLGGGRIGIGTRCIKVVRSGDTWSAYDVWQHKFSPGFNDMVRFGDYLYGLESGRLVCLEAATGQQKWKDGLFGTGQLLKVGERLLVLSERGKLVQVKPSPDGLQVVAELPILSDKTWNHPAIANGRLYARNGREMVCYELNK